MSKLHTHTHTHTDAWHMYGPDDGEELLSGDAVRVCDVVDKCSNHEQLLLPCHLSERGIILQRLRQFATVAN